MTKDRVRAVLCVLAVAFALVTVFATKPSNDNSEALVEVLIDSELNNDRAEGAPQQQVVNGWAARDLLAVQSRQLDELNSALWGLSCLVAIAVALLGWQAFTARSVPEPRPETNSGEASPPMSPATD